MDKPFTEIIKFWLAL